MKKNVLYKIFIALIIFFIIILLNSNSIFARINTDIEINNRLQNEAKPVGDKVIGGLKVIGIFVSVAMTVVVGIKYMVCSVEEKAEYKKTAILYFIGAVLIFTTTGFVGFIYDIIN